MEPTPADLIMGLFAIQPFTCKPVALSVAWLILFSLGDRGPMMRPYLR